MSIAPNKVVSVFYTLTDDQGNVIDSNKGQEQALTYIQGAGMMIPGFEKALEGAEAGQQEPPAGPRAGKPRPWHPGEGS